MYIQNLHSLSNPTSIMAFSARCMCPDSDPDCQDDSAVYRKAAFWFMYIQYLYSLSNSTSLQMGTSDEEILA